MKNLAFALLGIALCAPTVWVDIAAAASRPCQADAEKFCKDVKPGGGRIIECLKSHETELSSECRSRGAELREARQELKSACKDDIRKFCGDVKVGAGRILRCMKEHEPELSDACKKERAELKDTRRRRT
jgi:hypothetical protein